MDEWWENDDRLVEPALNRPNVGSLS